MQEARDLVLIVEDDTPFNEVIQSRLRREQIDVLSAQNGIEGGRLYEEHDVDLVIMDVILPGESGISLLRKFRNNGTKKDIPILLISALEEDTVQNRLKDDSQYDGFVQKPCSMDDLWDEIKKHLSR